MRYHYKVDIVWSEEDRCYIATVPELKGCMTHGPTYPEAARRAEEAIESWIAVAKKYREPVPEPIATKKLSGKFVLRIPREIHRKLAIKAKEEHVSLNHLASGVLAKYA